MDDAVGIVLDKLKDLGLDKNTVVIFTSDNGGVASGDAYSTTNLPLRGGKGYQWEGGIREPYFIAVPWLNHQSAKTDVMATGTDFYPTILDLAGISLKPEQHMDGVSLLPVLKGNAISERPLFWHYPHYGNQGGEPSSIIREGIWKLIRYYEDGRHELYNLESDPQEQNNLAESESQQLTSLSKKLDDWLASVNAKLPEADPEFDPEKLRDWQDRIINVRLPRLEQQRRDFLSPDFDPGNSWWDSELKQSAND